MLSEYITSLANVSFHTVAYMYARFRYSGKNPMRFVVFWRISVRFCGFRTPLTPPSLKCYGGVLFLRESSQCKKQHHNSTSSLQFVKTSTEYPKILFNYCAHARIILNFSKNICSIFVTFPKSDRRRKYTMLNYKE